MKKTEKHSTYYYFFEEGSPASERAGAGDWANSHGSLGVKANSLRKAWVKVKFNTYLEMHRGRFATIRSDMCVVRCATVVRYRGSREPESIEWDSKQLAITDKKVLRELADINAEIKFRRMLKDSV